MAYSCGLLNLCRSKELAFFGAQLRAAHFFIPKFENEVNVVYKDGDYLCFDAPTGQIRFHEDLKKYYQMLTNFRTEAESLSMIIDSASGPSFALESVSAAMLHFVDANILTPLANYGEYNLVAEDFLKSNTGCALLYEATQNYYNFSNEFQERVNRSASIEKQKASITADRQIQGTGVGVITSDPTMLMLYSSFDKMVAGFQASKAQKAYDEEAMRIDLLAGKTIREALEEQRRNVYGPQAKKAVHLALEEMLKSFCGYLESVNQFHTSCLSGIDEARSNAVMERIETVPSKQALFYTSVQLCPYNLGTFLLAEHNGVVLDEAAKEIMECFGLTDAVVDNIKDREQDRLRNGEWNYSAHQGDIREIAFLTGQSERNVCKSLFLSDYQEDIADYCHIVTTVKSGQTDAITATVRIDTLEEGDMRLAFYSACGFSAYDELSKTYGKPMRSLLALTDAVNEAWITETAKAEQNKAKAKREADRIAAEQAREEERKRKKRVKALTAVLIVAIAAVVAVPRIELQNTYNEATELLADGKYTEAKAIFAELGDYKDSQNLMIESSYRWYKQRLEQGDCSYDVESGFEELGDYKDSAELESEVQYERAVQFMNKGQYASASSLFNKAGEYKDAQDKATEMKYLYAKEKIELGNYYVAKKYLIGLGDYKDSAELLKGLSAMS